MLKIYLVNKVIILERILNKNNNLERGRYKMKRLFIFFMSLMFVMCLAGCDNVNKDDFESFINVNKTNVKVGETIKITASIKNNSNKSIKIKANHTSGSKN